MVGVPGKSKGCSTCRRRKIRCDLLKPDCLNCTKTGRACDGYERYLTFLNNTPEGRQKRVGLEEAKPRTSGTVSSSSRSSTAATSPPPTGNNSEGTSLSSQVSNIALQDDQIIACFWNKFMPADVSAQDPSPAPWLQHIISYGESGPALQFSLKALAMTRLGWINGDAALSTRGRSNYGLALKSLQKALYDKTLMWQDDTLASAYCLSIYELFEATNDNIKGWNAHVSGMGYLIQMRGPDQYHTPIARSVLHSFSFASMIQSVQFRRGTFLNSPEWRNKPFALDKKEIQYRLFEFGFEIGALMEADDKSGVRGGKLDLQTSMGYPRVYAALITRLDMWFLDFLAESPSPMFWENGPDEVGTAEPHQPKPFAFPNLRLASITNSYWALKLILYNLTGAVCHALLLEHPTLQSHAPQGIADPQARQELLNLLNQYTKAHTLELATNILRAMPYVFNDRMGLTAAQQNLFPLRVALFVTRQYPGGELQWCEAIYQQLVEKKGLRYATEIAKRTDGPGRADQEDD